MYIHALVFYILIITIFEMRNTQADGNFAKGV